MKVTDLLKSHRIRVTLALFTISLLVVLSFFLPKEQDPNIGLTTDPAPPTVAITNPVGTLPLNRSVDYSAVHFTITKVEEAGAFSDDRKRAGAFTVRISVQVQASNKVQTPLGIDYIGLIRLVLPNGQVITPKLVSLYPVVFPHDVSNGFFDFPVTTQVTLSSLTLRFGSETSIDFSA